MATSGTYMAEVSLKGSAEQFYNYWKSKNSDFPDHIGHHVKNVTFDEGEHDSHDSIRTWNITKDGKQEVFKERRGLDDETKTITLKGIKGHVMEKLKMYENLFQFIPKSDDSCVCKITIKWENLNDEYPHELNSYMKFVKNLVVDMQDHVIKY